MNNQYIKYAKFPGKLIIVGFGSIGQATLPLILRHIEIDPSNITIITADNRGHKVAEKYGIKFVLEPISEDNYQTVLSGYVQKNDFLLNLSVDVSSIALIDYCRKKGALYLDTCIEPWSNVYFNPSIPPSKRSNYALRESALNLKTNNHGPTAVLCQGANPGLVSQFIKQALINLSKDILNRTPQPTTREDWSHLAKELDIKAIHISERDTQESKASKKVGEFVNTWSIDGFISEGTQPAELGWGSHEKHWPQDGVKHTYGCNASIYLNRPGASVKVRGWTPAEGPYHGFLITHNEAISIADFYTVKDKNDVLYRPTVYYAYHPCHDAVLSIHELAGKNWKQQKEKRLLMDEIDEGMDELGVLLMGHKKGAYWYGSQLSANEAKALVNNNNATSLQVAASVLAGVIWAIENPDKGIIEADELNYQRILQITSPYLGKLVGQYTDWTPLKDRGLLFPEDVDAEDPWQFKNFRV